MYSTYTGKIVRHAHKSFADFMESAKETYGILSISHDFAIKQTSCC